MIRPATLCALLLVLAAGDGGAAVAPPRTKKPPRASKSTQSPRRAPAPRPAPARRQAPARKTRAQETPRPRYDVSYLRGGSAAQVLERRRELGAVLGKSLFKRLRIVRVEDGYALVYPRRGDEASARQTAQGHTRILSARGLGEAVVVEHRDWVEIPERVLRAEMRRPKPAPVFAAAPAAVEASSSAAQPALTEAPAPGTAQAALSSAPPTALPQTQATSAVPAPAEGPSASTSVPAGQDISSDLPLAASSVPLAAVSLASGAAATVLSTAPATLPELTPQQRAATAELRRRLESTLQHYIDQLRRMRRISPDERTAWYVYDFTTGEKLVEINTDLKLQAASLIKPFVALAFMHEVREGRLPYDDETRARFEKMIQHSSNVQTNWAMQKLGGPQEVERLLREHYGHILKDIELVEYIPAGGRTYRNKASVADYGRFLFALWQDELPGAAEIKRLMALPKRDRLHTRTEVPEDAEVYSKTGSTSRLCGDMGVLSLPGPDGRQYAYAVVGIIEKQRSARNYFRWLRSRGNIIREISNLVYHGVGALHGVDSPR